MVAQVSSDTVYNDVDELRKLTTPDENTGKAELGLYDLIWFEDVTDGKSSCALQTDKSFAVTMEVLILQCSLTRTRRLVFTRISLYTVQ